MEELDQSSIGVAMNIYAHVLDDSKRGMSSRTNHFLSEDWYQPWRTNEPLE